MNASSDVKRRVARALLSGAVAAAGLCLSAGTAQADDNVGGPFQWCPGDSMVYSPTAVHFGTDNGPGRAYSWDMNICHTWYKLKDDTKGNVPYTSYVDGTYSPHSDVWDGDNPPVGEVVAPKPDCVFPCL